MKNKRALAVTIASLVALISLSCAASQRPLQYKPKPLPTYQKPMYKPKAQWGMAEKVYVDKAPGRPSSKFTDPTISRIRDPKRLRIMIRTAEDRIRRDQATLKAGLRSRKRKKQLKDAIENAQKKVSEYRSQLSTLQSKRPRN